MILTYSRNGAFFGEIPSGRSLLLSSRNAVFASDSMHDNTMHNYKLPASRRFSMLSTLTRISDRRCFTASDISGYVQLELFLVCTNAIADLDIDDIGTCHKLTGIDDKLVPNDLRLVLHVAFGIVK